MNPPTDAEVRNPIQLSRYLRDMAGRMVEMTNSFGTVGLTLTDPVYTNTVTAIPAERLPDAEIARLGLQDVPRTHNYTATAAPATSDNAAQGYGPGSFWLHAALPGVWLCVYADQSTATWIKLN